MMSKALFFAVTAALLGTSNAFWRMPCRGTLSPPTRLDPLMDPGVAADHPHVIHGGSNFGVSTNYDDLMGSECTSCGVTQDKSAYWTPPLYFMYSNGTTVAVPQVGGMLAYYLLYGENIKAFPKGFQLLAGDSRQRNFTWPVPDPPKSEWSGDQTSQLALSQKAIGFNCLNYDKNPPEGSLYRHFLPDKQYLDDNCKDGLRLEVMFPSCWNGKDVDSPNHQSHVKYPSLVMDGDCPTGFETRVPSMFYETIWDTNHFKGEDGKFVVGNGDPTGFGYHGDFIAAWDVDFLQSAINTCTNPSGNIQDCPLFNIQSEDKMKQCSMPKAKIEADDDCTGPRQGICGNVPIQYGPGYASVLHPGIDTQPSPTTPLATSAPSSSQVPVLSYSPGTSLATDQYGGGLTVAKLKTTGPAPSAPTPVAPAPPANSVNKAAAPAVTSAPSPADSSDAAQGSVISTSIYTVGQVVYDVAIEQVLVTFTA